jgi:tRNA pseudouridine(55) synthase
MGESLFRTTKERLVLSTNHIFKKNDYFAHRIDRKKETNYQEYTLTKKGIDNKKIKLGKDKGSKLKLSDKEIKELATLGKKLEKHYFFPQDIEWAIEKDKVYIAEATLGGTSTTYDGEGEITKLNVKDHPEISDVERVCQSFIGKIKQTPPIFSAIKVEGKRAYALARSGQEVKLNPRQVEIYNLEILDYAWPKLKFRVHVSSGTYIRSLINDIGANLGCGAYMSELRRVSIGEYEI